MSGESSSKLRGDEKEEKEPPLASYCRKRKIKVKWEPETKLGKEVAAVEEESSTIITSPKLPTCYICNKTFPSRKAVHGHMRSHPERPYRGMDPSTKPSGAPIRIHSDDQVMVNYKGSSSDSDSDSDSDGSNVSSDVKVVIPSWPSGARKRRTCGGGGGGGGGVGASSSSVEGEEDELVVRAACDLMLLRTGDDRWKNLPNKDGVRVWEVPPPRTTLPAESNKDGIRVSPQTSNKKARIEDQSSSGCGGKKRKRENADDKPPPSYKCSICGKCFVSPQALGGHTSSAHSASKMVIKSDPVLNGPCGASSDPCPSHHQWNDQYSSSKAVGATPTQHVCKICQMAFSSGQALGGHMRVHFKQPCPVGYGVVAAAAVVDDEAVVHLFDLNQLPADI